MNETNNFFCRDSPKRSNCRHTPHSPIHRLPFSLDILRSGEFQRTERPFQTEKTTLLLSPNLNTAFNCFFLSGRRIFCALLSIFSFFSALYSSCAAVWFVRMGTSIINIQRDSRWLQLLTYELDFLLTTPDC